MRPGAEPGPRRRGIDILDTSDLGPPMPRPEGREPPMRRVLVLGSGGAGKSTLATRLATLLDLPVVHLDREYWQAGWTEPDPAQWQKRVRELCAQPRWVMDGDYRHTLPERFAACDTAVFLDLPRWLCLGRVLVRSIRFFGRTRPDMNPGCAERLPRPHFLCSILTYPRRRRPPLLAVLGGAQRQTVFVLHSPIEVERFVAGLARSRTAVL